MRSFLFQAGANVNILDLGSDLSVLLTALVGVVWVAVGLISVMAGQHLLARTPNTPWQNQSVSLDEQATA